MRGDGLAGVVASGVCGTALVLASVELSAAAGPRPLTEADVTAAVTRIIEQRSKDGAFALRDPRTGQSLALVLDEVRIVRGLPEFGWFPEAIFRDRDIPKKKYALDFWLKPEGEGLRLMDVRVHKDAKPDGSSFMMITRAPLLWWWLPTLKRQSAVEGVQAWQVMGRIHEHIVGVQKDGAYPLSLADGKTVPTELVAIYQPVGRAKSDGRYFACAELRNKGGADAFYAVDFWLDPDARSVKAGTARPIENPRAESGKPASEPRCRIEDLAFEVVE